MVREATPPVLEIAPSASGQMGPLVPLSLFLVACAVLWATGLLPGWEALASGAVIGAIVTFGLVTALRSRQRGRVLRLDAEGVTARDHPTVPWEDVVEVAVTSMQPGWLSRSGGRPWPVVAIVPRPGVQVPSLRLPGGPGPADRFGDVRERRYGSRLLLVPHATSASTEEILSAVWRRGRTTVSDRRPARRS